MKRKSQDGKHEAHGSKLANGLKGGLAGAVGVWMMDRVDWFLFRHEDPEARRQTERVRPGGMDPAHVVAHKIADKLDVDLSPSQADNAGTTIRYALGMRPASVYGIYRDRLPVDKPGQEYLWGLGLGLALFLTRDEVGNALLGSAAKPQEYPWQAHARGLAAHLTFGLVTHAVLNAMNVPRPMPKKG